jgi:hypothetical protein
LRTPPLLSGRNHGWSAPVACGLRSPQAPGYHTTYERHARVYQEVHGCCNIFGGSKPSASVAVGSRSSPPVLRWPALMLLLHCCCYCFVCAHRTHGTRNCLSPTMRIAGGRRVRFDGQCVWRGLLVVIGQPCCVLVVRGQRGAAYSPHAVPLVLPARSSEVPPVSCRDRLQNLPLVLPGRGALPSG